MRRWIIGVLAAMTLTPGAAVSAAASDATLIPRSALFGNPVRTQARLSPDGKYVSFLAPLDGVLNVWLAPYGKLGSAKAITQDKKRGIREHFWAADARHVLYTQDEGGDENWRVHSIDVDSGKQVDLTPLAGVQAQVVGVSHKRPSVVLVGLNDREPEWHDLYLIDVSTGERKLVERNAEEFAGYVPDFDLAPRIALKTLPSGGGELFRRAGEKWERFLEYGPEDSLTTAPLAIEGDGRTALLLSAVGRDKAALVRVDLASGKQSMVGESGQADISDIWLEPRTHQPQAYAVDYLHTEITPLTPEAGKDIKRLESALGPQFSVTSRTLDDRKWIVVVND